MLRLPSLLMLAFSLVCLTPAAGALSSENSRSTLAGISFTDPPIQLPVTESFEDAMLNVATDLQRRCRTIEAYGWRLRQAEQKRVNDIFDSTALQLGAGKYKLVPRTPRSASPEVTVFTADKPEKSLLFLWSAGELGLVLLICDTDNAATTPAAMPDKPKPAAKKPAAAKNEPNDADLPPVMPEDDKAKNKTAKPKETTKPAAKTDTKADKPKTEAKAKSAKPEAKKTEPKKPDSKKPDAKKPAPAKPEVKKPETKKPETKKTEPAKPVQKKETAKPAPKPKPIETVEPKNIAPEVQEMLESLPDIGVPVPAPETALPQPPETPDMPPITPSEAARQNDLMPAPITTAPGVLLSPDVMPLDDKPAPKPASKAPEKPAPQVEIPVLEPAEIKEKIEALVPVPPVGSAPEPPFTLPEAPSEIPMPPPPPQ